MAKEFNDEHQLELEVEEVEIVTLTDENGVEEDFEILDFIDYEGKRYVFLLPASDEDVIPDEDDEPDEIMILQVVENGEDETYVSIDDEDIMDTLFDIFKERFQDDFNFEE